MIELDKTFNSTGFADIQIGTEPVSYEALISSRLNLKGTPLKLDFIDSPMEIDELRLQSVFVFPPLHPIDPDRCCLRKRIGRSSQRIGIRMV